MIYLPNTSNPPLRLFQTPFGRIPLPIEISKKEPQWELSIPKIPLKLFWEVANWQREIAAEHKCESTTSLFLIDNEWVAVPFFQQNRPNAMTIDIDYTTQDNADLLAQYADRSIVHGSLHNHVNGGAGQSGKDHSDEVNLPGPHITLGNMSSEKLSYHGRFSVIEPTTGAHFFVPMSILDIVDVDKLMLVDTADVRKAIEVLILTVPAVNYPKEWKNRFQIEEWKSYHNPHTRTSSGKRQYWNNNTQEWVDSKPNSHWNERHYDNRHPSKKNQESSSHSKAFVDEIPHNALKFLRTKVSVKNLDRFKKSCLKAAEREDEVALVLAQCLMVATDLEDLYTQLQP